MAGTRWKNKAKEKWEKAKEKMSQIANSRPAGWATSASFGAGVTSAVIVAKDAAVAAGAPSMAGCCGAAAGPLGWIALAGTFIFSSCLHSHRTAATDREVHTLKEKLRLEQKRVDSHERTIRGLETKAIEQQSKMDAQTESLNRIVKILKQDAGDKASKFDSVMVSSEAKSQSRLVPGSVVVMGPQYQSMQPGRVRATSSTRSSRAQFFKAKDKMQYQQEDAQRTQQLEQEYEASRQSLSQLKAPLLIRS